MEGRYEINLALLKQVTSEEMFESVVNRRQLTRTNNIISPCLNLSLFAFNTTELKKLSHGVLSTAGVGPLNTMEIKTMGI